MRGSRGAGQAWEDAAGRALVSEGYRILQRNFRSRVGEIDFVAMDGDVLCFVEVKGRRGSGFGMPEEAVTPEKQRRIFRAAQWYLTGNRGAAPRRRFDVVSILDSGGPPEVRILRGAFVGPPRPRRRR
jgi:putative endonuclease